MRGSPSPPGPIGVALLRERLRRGGTVRDTARGGSMAPLIPSGSEIEFAPVRLERLVPGDVVLVDLGGRAVAHRLLRCPRPRSPLLRTKGDANLRPDPPVCPGDVIGVAVRLRRPEGRWVELRSPLCRLLSLAWLVVTPWIGLARALRRSTRSRR